MAAPSQTVTVFEARAGFAQCPVNRAVQFQHIRPAPVLRPIQDWRRVPGECAAEAGGNDLPPGHDPLPIHARRDPGPARGLSSVRAERGLGLPGADPRLSHSEEENLPVRLVGKER